METVFSYVVANTGEEAVTVDGLDVLPPNSEKLYSAQDAENFFHSRGLKLLQDNVPAGIEVTVVVPKVG